MLSKNQQSILDLLSTVIEIKQCENNKRDYISKECPFCGYVSKRPFRYNTKKKVGKSFCCGASFKEKRKLQEVIKYNHWLKDTLCTNYGRCMKPKISDDDHLPF